MSAEKKERNIKRELDEIVGRLKAQANPENVAGMARFGINPEGTLGISMPVLRKMGKEIGRDQDLSLALWHTGIHEARILAALTGEPERVTKAQMERWVKDFDSWDVCDQVCMNLFDRVPFAYRKALQWSGRRPEFIKRAGFALMAVLAWHDREADDGMFEEFLPVIVREATDERNFVKKAVNWALRQIGKRSSCLNSRAIEAANEIAEIDSKAARWIARDALNELESEKVRERLT